MLTPYLSQPLEVLHKLQREAYRAFHEPHIIHKADHLYNFCITALSMKDYILKSLGKITDAEKQPYYDKWSNQSCLRAATEIANTAKHFSLKAPPKTNAVFPSTTGMVNIYEDNTGNLHTAFQKDYPDYKVVLESGTELTLHEFTKSVLNYWKEDFSNLGFDYTPQDKEVLYGTDDF